MVIYPAFPTKRAFSLNPTPQPRAHAGNMRSATLLPFLAVVLLSLAPQIRAAQPKILYLGDSLSMGAFGRTLDEQLRSRKNEVHTYVAGGASPYYWLSRFEPISCSIGYWEKTPNAQRRVGYVRAVPKVEALLKKIKPDVVVIQTGVNLYATLRSKRREHTENVKLVEGLIADMCRAVHSTGAHSYWITPPESHPKRFSPALQQQLSEIMKRVVGGLGGQIFQSAEVTTWTASYPSNSDGIHYGPDQSIDWANQVVEDFSQFVSKLDQQPKPRMELKTVNLVSKPSAPENSKTAVVAEVVAATGANGKKTAKSAGSAGKIRLPSQKTPQNRQTSRKPSVRPRLAAENRSPRRGTWICPTRNPAKRCKCA